MQAAYAIMNTAMSPALAAGPLYVIAISAAIVSLLFAVIYRLLVDRRKSEFVRTELKSMKGRMKKARENRDEKELKALMSNMLQLQNQQMLLSMKPMLVSLVFVAVIFSWLSYMYGDTTVALSGGAGVFRHGDFQENFTVSREDSSVTVTLDGTAVKAGEPVAIDGKSWAIIYQDDVRGFFGRLFGGAKTEGIKFRNLETRFKVPYSEKTMSWLWLYIIMSFPVTMVSRKVLGVD